MRDLRADAADGERAIRFSPNGGGGFVDVCPLCAGGRRRVRLGPGGRADDADGLDGAEARRGGGWLAAILGTRPRTAEETIAPEPILRRLSDQELAIVEAADLFNASQYRRTVGGIAKSLGTPQARSSSLSGVNSEVVVTVAWDISWYQYRVSPDSDNPVRLEGRGHDPTELEGAFTDWNARMEEDGRIVPDIASL